MLKRKKLISVIIIVLFVTFLALHMKILINIFSSGVINYSPHADWQGTILISHRGIGDGTAIENSVDAVRKGLDSGAEAVEVDVGETSDGVIMVHHDLDFATQPFSYWRSKYPYVPTLQEILDVVKAKTDAPIRIVVDMKDVRTHVVEHVIQQLEENGLAEYAIVGGWDHKTWGECRHYVTRSYFEVAAQVRSLNPKVKTVVNVCMYGDGYPGYNGGKSGAEGVRDTYNYALSDSSVDVIFVSLMMIYEKRIVVDLQEANRRDKMLMIYANTPGYASIAAGWKADFIMTDYIRQLRTVVPKIIIAFRINCFCYNYYTQRDNRRPARSLISSN